MDFEFFRNVKLRIPASILASSVLAASAMAPLIAGAAYPEGHVTLVVNTEAGGPTDVSARILAQKLNENSGMRFVVENRGGASGATGIQHVKRARPDGYTMLYAFGGSMTGAPIINPELGFDPIADFDPVVMTWQAAPMYILTQPGTDIKSVKEIVDQAKATPDKFFFSSAGAGAVTSLGMVAFTDFAGIKMQEVPYKGTAPAVSALLSKQVQFTLAQPVSFKQFASTGQIIPLAVFSSKRDPEFPNVPTIAEAGYPQVMEISDWAIFQGLWAPKGTPKEIVTLINTAVNAALRDSNVVNRTKGMGMESFGDLNVERSAAYHVKSYNSWKTLVNRYKTK